MQENIDADPRHLAVLESLAEKNRIARLRADNKTRRQEATLKAKENGFDTMYSGANKERVDHKLVERERQLQQQQFHNC